MSSIELMAGWSLRTIGRMAAQPYTVTSILDFAIARRTLRDLRWSTPVTFTHETLTEPLQ
jgi:hypothetical protein